MGARNTDLRQSDAGSPLGCYTCPVSQTKTLMTAEQLWETAGRPRCELVRGELVEMSPVGRKHSRNVMLLGSWMTPFARERGLGEVGTELGFVLFRNPDVVRAPDISFLSKARLGSIQEDGFVDGAPDLAVEMVSPDDRASDLEEKVREYLAAGTRLVWKADARTGTITAYRPSGEARVYGPGETVSGEDVLPGFSFRPDDLFSGQ